MKSPFAYCPYHSWLFPIMWLAVKCLPDRRHMANIRFLPKLVILKLMQYYIRILHSLQIINDSLSLYWPHFFHTKLVPHNTSVPQIYIQAINCLSCIGVALWDRLEAIKSTICQHNVRRYSCKLYNISFLNFLIFLFNFWAKLRKCW